MDTLERLNQLNYGYGYNGDNKTFKARFKTELADQIVTNIPKEHHCVLITYKTYQGDHTFIAMMAHRSHIAWVIFERAVIKSKGEVLAKKD